MNYYIIKAEGKYLDSFINKLCALNINIYDIKYKKDCILFKISYKDLDKIKDIKTVNNITIEYTSGIKRIRNVFKNNKIFFIFLLISFFIIYLLFNITFKINIEGVSKDFKNDILKELSNNNINIFTLKKSYNYYEKVSNKIKNKYKDKIEWIEIEEKGMTLNINIIERKTNKEITEETPGNIVASKNGVIKNIISTKGQILKDINDYVKKGDIIISGAIYRNNKPIDIVSPEGKVYAEVWYKVTLSSKTKVPFKIVKKDKRMLYISFLNHKIKLIKINGKNKKNIYNGIFFKIGIENIKYEKTIYKDLTKKELEKYLLNKAYIKIKQNLKSDEKILDEKTLKIYNNNGKMYLEVFIKTYENIALKTDEVKLIEQE